MRAARINCRNLTRCTSTLHPARSSCVSFLFATRMSSTSTAGASAGQPASRHRGPSLVADIAVMRAREGKREVLMIKRGGRTFHGWLAFPGGFVDYGEDPKHAALRELQEETSLVGTDPQLVGVYGDPARDPRGHTVSVFYYVTVKDFSTMKAGSDAAHAEFYDVEELEKLTDKMAFDHGVLFHDLLGFIKKHNIEITRM